MIIFKKKAEPETTPSESGTNRFEQIRKAAREGQRKVETGTLLPDPAAKPTRPSD